MLRLETTTTHPAARRRQSRDTSLWSSAAILRQSYIASFALLLAVGCSKQEEPQKFGPPRRIRPTVEDLPALKAEYILTEQSRITFKVPAGRHSPAGTFSRVTGRLIVDALALGKTRGTVEVHLASLSMDGASDEGSAPALRALNWFGLGSAVADPIRERIRTAEFHIETIRDLSAGAAHEGELANHEGAPPSQEADSSLPAREQRQVTLTAVGALRIRTVRVRVAARLQADFFYRAPAISGARPEKITITTRSAFPVSLQAHDIVPRDESGVVLAQELKLLGRQVGREAKVSAALVARER